MITPRRTRLVRVPDLQAFRAAIVELSPHNQSARRVVLVPTGGAARQLRRTFGSQLAPELLTREQFYDALHQSLGKPPRRLTAYDRDVMVQAAARQASDTLGRSAALRPGLIAEILRFYDQLRRQARNVDRFEELLDEALSRDSEHDRGAERMLAQARFLAATFQGYEHRVEASGACDEHTLRERLIAEPAATPIVHVIVTVGDWIADPGGLYLADFDLLTRLPALETIDIVATDGLLGSGFHQRIHDWLPGIEEVVLPGATSRPRPTLTVPGTATDQLVFVRRDREEELIAIARGLRADRVHERSLERVAVVFKRPLPYLYLAREVFREAGLPYQAFDALPLAAEPYAAALDLVFEFVESGFTRQSTVALLRSPHFVFEWDGQRIDRESVSALDAVLSSRRYLGGLERMSELVTPIDGDGSEGVTAIPGRPEGRPLRGLTGRVRPSGRAGVDAGASEDAGPALRAAYAAATALAPLSTAAPASAQFLCLGAFLDAHDSQDADSRGRSMVRDVLSMLTAAHSHHDDRSVDVKDIAASVRRWIEEHTLVAESSGEGVQLLDDQAARYGEFDDLNLVGLIEGEWPERPSRNIFYPTSLLASLGWPTEKDRRAAAEVRFLELLQSPLVRTMVSTVSLDDEALVEPSTLADEIPNARLSTMPIGDHASPDSVVGHALQGVPNGVPDDEPAEWPAIRSGRSSHDEAAFHGQVEPLSARTWSISGLETYLGCPFKFFAQHVLKLEEEPDDEEVMDPRRQGQFVHEVFEKFFARWQQEGHQSITPDTLATARSMFREVVESALKPFSDTEAALERTRLLGSPAAAGLGEAVFRMEAERPVPVIDRLLERRLKGEFTFDTASGPRRLSLSGKADRIDMLADGTFRVIDYKLGWPPNRARALQLPIYGLCAEQSLDGHLGRRWTLGEAAYLAFKGPKRVVGLFSTEDERRKVLTDAQQRLVDTVDNIAAGRFPPTPDDVFRCETCTYASVCRKDYVGDV